MVLKIGEPVISRKKKTSEFHHGSSQKDAHHVHMTIKPILKITRNQQNHEHTLNPREIMSNKNFNLALNNQNPRHLQSRPPFVEANPNPSNLGMSQGVARFLVERNT